MRHATWGDALVNTWFVAFAALTASWEVAEALGSGHQYCDPIGPCMFLATDVTLVMAALVVVLRAGRSRR